MHIHGGPFQVVARDGETLAPDQRFMVDTVNVGPGRRYDVIWESPQGWQVDDPLPNCASHN
jgi:FtsP/CotA-like multicopper oxidase with cupredoxin domain